MIRNWLNGLGRRIKAARRAVRTPRDRWFRGLEGLEGRALLASFMVTSLDGTGTGPGTLRKAIVDADIDPGSTIQFSVTGTITLTSVLPSLTENVTISGPGASKLAIDGGGPSSNFSILSVPSGVTVALSGLTLADGNVNGSSGLNPGSGGGGIDNLGTLTVTECIISGDTATAGDGGPYHPPYGGDGGGINNLGTLTVNDCTISGDTATGTGGGGGICNDGTLTVNGSLLSGDVSNGSFGDGGAISNHSTGNGSVTVINSTLSGNSATPNGGGGIYNGNGTDPPAKLTVIGSTLSGNSSPGNGGGISNYGVLTVSNSTLADNLTQGRGGGINSNGSVEGSGLTVSDSTVSGNSATIVGGGIYAHVSGFPNSTITLNNTIVAGNTLSDDITPSDYTGSLSALSQNNLIGSEDLAGLVNGVNGNLVGVVDPGLGPLGSNGGPTQTIGLLAGSPAIDAGNNALAADPITNQPLTTDQRGTGFPRIMGASVDIGAVEFSQGPITASRLVLTSQPPGSVPADSGFGLTVTAEDGAGNVATSFNGAVSVALGSNPGGAILKGTLTATAVNGVATFSGLTLNKIDPGYTLQVTSGSLPAATTTGVNVSVAPSFDFVIGSDSQVYLNALDPSGNPTGGYSQIASGQVQDLAATTFNSGHGSEAFVIGMDNQVYAATISGTIKSGYFATAYGSIASISAGTDANGNPILFAIGTDHQLYEQTFNSSGKATSPSYAKAAYGDFQSAALTHDASGNPLLYAVGQDGQVYGLKMTATGAPNGGLFKMASGGVKQLTTGTTAGGFPEVFVVGLDNYVYALKTDGTGRPVGGYLGVGGPVESISVGSSTSGDPLLFVVGTDGQVYGHRFDASGTPTGGFYGTSAGLASSIAVGVAANDDPELFLSLTGDSQVYLGPLDPTGTSTGPFALSTPGAVKKIVVV